MANPAARSVTPRLLAQIERELERLADRVCTRYTGGPRETVSVVEATVAAAREVDCGLDVVCAGGDGTVRATAEGLARGLGSWHGDGTPFHATLSLVPAGSGNSAYRALWGELGWAEGLRSALGGRDREVRVLDLLRIRETNRASVLGVNAGLGARVTGTLQRTAHVDDELRTRVIVEAIGAARPYRGRVTVDGATLHEGAITHVSVGGVRSFMGGRLQLLPRAELDDGLLDVCLITEVDTPTLGEIAALMSTGDHLDHPCIRYAQGTRALLEETAGDGLFFEHDGDVQPALASVTIDVVPAAVPAAMPGEEDLQMAMG